MKDQCDHCDNEEEIGKLRPALLMLSGGRDAVLGEYCTDCAERLDDGELSIELTETEK